MSVSVKTKEKPTTTVKAKAKQALSEMANAVDTYAMAHNRVCLLTTEIDELNSIKQTALNVLMVEVNSYEPTQAVLVNGNKAVLEFSPKQQQRVVGAIETVRKELGDELFFKLCKVNLGDLDKYVTPPVLEKIVKQERTGRRAIKVIPKEPC